MGQVQDRGIYSLRIAGNCLTPSGGESKSLLSSSRYGVEPGSIGFICCSTNKDQDQNPNLDPGSGAYREDDEVEHTGKTETGIPEMTERGRAFALTIV